jgi:glycerol-3-phosphate dehydrogenase (NAD(P)+)
VKRLAIIGGGAWGTALAMVAARAGSGVSVWARNPEVVAAINSRHENPWFLPGIPLEHSITATTELADAMADAGAALLVVPAQYLRGVLASLAPLLPPSAPLLLCAKGIETESLMTMSELAGEFAPGSRLAVLSGPSFAAEVARGMPTAVTVAGRDAALGRGFMAALGTERFRPYLSQDPIGAEIGGAVKNVMAIACGIVAGRQLGDNAQAALITRGLAEMVRLGLAKGADPETFRGLSGIGDLVLTCTAGQSRNHALGIALGRGESVAGALAARQRSVVEGVDTAAAVTRLASRLGIEMPITAAVDGVLHHGVGIDAMIEALLNRPWRSE